MPGTFTGRLLPSGTIPNGGYSVARLFPTPVSFQLKAEFCCQAPIRAPPATYVERRQLDSPEIPGRDTRQSHQDETPCTRSNGLPHYRCPPQPPKRELRGLAHSISVSLWSCCESNPGPSSSACGFSRRRHHFNPQGIFRLYPDPAIIKG